MAGSPLRLVVGVACVLLGCQTDVAVADDMGETTVGTSTASTGTAESSSTTLVTTETSAATTGSSSPDDPVKLDVFPTDTTGPTGCVVGEDGKAPLPCDVQAPADSFDPDIQWTWTSREHPSSWATPLVANLTDDNGDGMVDPCDTPDVIVVARAVYYEGHQGFIYVLDGATGVEHFMIETPVDNYYAPAVGDIDGDGSIDIVAHGASVTDAGSLVAFERDGTLKWSHELTNLQPDGELFFYGDVALGDVDNDGTAEIVSGDVLFDHEGEFMMGHQSVLSVTNEAGVDIGMVGGPTAMADLDDDGDLEIVQGRAAYHHDGSTWYLNEDVWPGIPAIANLDDDGDPEVVVTNGHGITILEHDGTAKYLDQRPTGVEEGFYYGNWHRPAAIHDVDGDGHPEIMSSAAELYGAYHEDLSVLFTAPVEDLSGVAGGTAFDFLGDGSAEAMYADESTMFVFDIAGEALLSIPRTSRTVYEYPVVADVDNDGSAEIVVVSDEGFPSAGPPSPTVQVIRDVDDRWIPARRIWNQHTYHVTNVREDGSIPEQEPHHWEQLNTFRTNAQITVESGGVCTPEG